MVDLLTKATKAELTLSSPQITALVDVALQCVCAVAKPNIHIDLVSTMK